MGAPARSGSLFEELPTELPDELVEVVLRTAGLRVERIVSRGHRSPEGFWYEQDEDEWVVLLAGAAGLEIDGEAAVRTLGEGDWVALPAGLRHRVAWTAPGQTTVWLALFTPAIEGAGTA